MTNVSDISYNFPLLIHNFVAQFYMFLVLSDGEYEVSVNEFTLSNQDQTIIIIKPGDYAQLQFNQCSGYAVVFDDSFFSQRYHENNLRLFDFFQPGALPYGRLGRDHLLKLKSMLEFMLDEYQSSNGHKETVLRSYLNILLFSFKQVETLSVSLTKPVAKMVNEKVFEFVTLVDEYYKEAKTPSFYADKLCVTPNYLNKLCKQERGVTAGHIVRQRIMIEAKRLLRFTSFTIKEVANELCFDSTSYFVTFFKKFEGKTPEEYRKYIV
ncbi:helix-turn-helix domain-containing protein [Myroides pelagicus]|nr:helix-turn-helix domain-containing protein [Myroides pelagicus]MEC4114506.1 helix-turn-helix domain-containing protein [Myroides pelagicus]